MVEQAQEEAGVRDVEAHARGGAGVGEGVVELARSAVEGPRGGGGDALGVARGDGGGQADGGDGVRDDKFVRGFDCLVSSNLQNTGKYSLLYILAGVARVEGRSYADVCGSWFEFVHGHCDHVGYSSGAYGTQGSTFALY